MGAAPQIVFPPALLRALHDDPEKSARAAELVYVNDTTPGIRRVKRGERFEYLYRNKKIKDTETLIRIKSLVIPPAWRDVWICPRENGHLQATGFDLRKRKQYRYHPHWNQIRNQTKFHRLAEFGRCLPALRKQIDDDLNLRGLPLRKVLAAIVAIMEATSIRVGNGVYEKLYGSFGLTTLKDRHVRITGQEIKFFFTGKKGISHRISVRSKRLAAIVKKCRDIPGRELFQYIDETGARRSVDSGMVNEYIRELTGKDFTAKDFRTWLGSVQALRCYVQSARDKESGVKKLLNQVLDGVAGFLGNTRNVCRKYYVHPVIVDLIEQGRLDKYIRRLKNQGAAETGVIPFEKTLLNILEKEPVAA